MSANAQYFTLNSSLVDCSVSGRKDKKHPRAERVGRYASSRSGVFCVSLLESLAFNSWLGWLQAMRIGAAILMLQASPALETGLYNFAFKGFATTDSPLVNPGEDSCDSCIFSWERMAKLIQCLFFYKLAQFSTTTTTPKSVHTIQFLYGAIYIFQNEMFRFANLQVLQTLQLPWGMQAWWEV